MEITRSWGVFITLANIDHGGREKEKVNTEGGGGPGEQEGERSGKEAGLGGAGKAVPFPALLTPSDDFPALPWPWPTGQAAPPRSPSPT